MSLLPGYSLRPATEDEFMSLYNERETQYFAGFERTNFNVGLTDDDLTRIADRERAFAGGERTRWFIISNDVVVGWALVQQVDSITLLMRNTAIDPEHRRRGIYAALLAFVVQHARDNGYQRITSTHSATNNAILIAKLKAGFVISGLHVDEKYGLMVHLTNYLYEQRRTIVERRVRGV